MVGFPKQLRFSITLSGRPPGGGKGIVWGRAAPSESPFQTPKPPPSDGLCRRCGFLGGVPRHAFTPLHYSSLAVLFGAFCTLQ